MPKLYITIPVLNTISNKQGISLTQKNTIEPVFHVFYCWLQRKGNYQFIEKRKSCNNFER